MGRGARTSIANGWSISVVRPGHLPIRLEWRRTGRAAHDQARLQPAVLGAGEFPSLHDGQKQADRLFALATDRLMHRRERGVHVRGEVDVVEADDADIAR